MQSQGRVTASETRIAAHGVQSLVWDGDALVDWIDGGTRYNAVTGEVTPSNIRYAYPFDAALALPGSPYSVIYTRCGTKGLILENGQVRREINRSHYHADVYEYPVALFRLPSGREVLAHCPDDYCRLDMEDLATGEMLTRSLRRKPKDFFHSRLGASPDGRYLVSAGWLWHPVDSVEVYDVEQALKDPTLLDGGNAGVEAFADESSAAFLPDGRLVIALKGGIDDQEGATADGEIRIYALGNRQAPEILAGVGRLGKIAAIGNDHLLSFHEHPRLIDLRTGGEVLAWPQLKSGTQTSSILMSGAELPATAVDSQGLRFAVADATGITVVQLFRENT